MHYLSICAVIKNEAPYLKEWIEFHLLQGVDHFYLFDNESEDNTKKLLKDYPDVTYHYWPKNPPQGAAYNYVINEYKELTRWCAFIDADEFLFSPTNRPVADVLSDMYDSAAISGLAVRWYLFGSNGKEKYENKAVLNRFTKRSKTIDKHCKSIMRLSETTSMGNDPHTFRACNKIINEKGEVMPHDYAILPNETADILRINHMVTKSKEEYFKRRGTLPDANSGAMKDPNIMFGPHDVNDVSCNLIHKNIEALTKQVTHSELIEM